MPTIRMPSCYSVNTPSTTLVRLLNQAEVPARTVHGLVLEDGRRRQSLQPFVQVFEGDAWRLFDPKGARRCRTRKYCSGSRRGPGAGGGGRAQLAGDLLHAGDPAVRRRSGEQGTVTDAVFNLSIHSLPLSEQAIFQSILLLPLGALVVVFFRVVVGLETSGTFMPVLIALAFLEMNLLPGLITFLLVVGAAC